MNTRSGGEAGVPRAPWFGLTPRYPGPACHAFPRRCGGKGQGAFAIAGSSSVAATAHAEQPGRASSFPRAPAPRPPVRPVVHMDTPPAGGSYHRCASRGTDATRGCGQSVPIHAVRGVPRTGSTVDEERARGQATRGVGMAARALRRTKGGRPRACPAPTTSRSRTSVPTVGARDRGLAASRRARDAVRAPPVREGLAPPSSRACHAPAAPPAVPKKKAAGAGGPAAHSGRPRVRRRVPPAPGAPPSPRVWSSSRIAAISHRWAAAAAAARWRWRARRRWPRRVPARRAPGLRR